MNTVFYIIICMMCQWITAVFKEFIVLEVSNTWFYFYPLGFQFALIVSIIFTYVTHKGMININMVKLNADGNINGKDEGSCIITSLCVISGVVYFIFNCWYLMA